MISSKLAAVTYHGTLGDMLEELHYSAGPLLPTELLAGQASTYYNGSSRSSTLRARCICMALGGWPWFAWSSQMCPVCVRRRMGSCAQAAFGGRDGMNMRGGESAASQACRRGGRHRRTRSRRRPPATAPMHGRRSLRVPATHLGAPAPTAAPGPSTILLPATSDWSGPRCDEAPSPVGPCIP